MLGGENIYRRGAERRETEQYRSFKEQRACVNVSERDRRLIAVII